VTINYTSKKEKKTRIYQLYWFNLDLNHFKQRLNIVNHG